MAKKKEIKSDGPCIIQVRSEADLAKLIDLVRMNPDKVGQSLYDSSARWEQLYFGEPLESTAVRTFFEPVTVAPMNDGMLFVRGGRIKCGNKIA